MKREGRTIADTNARKRQRALEALHDPDMQDQSDRQLARWLGVSQPFVSQLRRALEGKPTDNVITSQPPLRVGQTDQDRPATHPPLTGELLASCGCSPQLGARILARLAAMPADERQRTEGVLATVLI